MCFCVLSREEEASRVRRSASVFACVEHTCAPHADIWTYRRTYVGMDGQTWRMARLPRYRSSSWPPRVMPYPLALHNNLPRRVCSGISARTLLPALLFPSPLLHRRPSLLSLDRCCGCVFLRPSFIHLFALREPGAVGVPLRRSFRRRFVCLLDTEHIYTCARARASRNSEFSFTELDRQKCGNYICVRKATHFQRKLLSEVYDLCILH